MLQLAHHSNNFYHNTKCGEIFCVSPAVYNVTCCICAIKMHYDQFPSHFQMQHLTLEEETINLVELQRKRRATLAKDASLIDNMAIKKEDPEDDPIKQEDDEDVDVGDMSLLELLRDTENKHNEGNNVNQDIRIHTDGEKFGISEKLQLRIAVGKPNTRYPRKSNIKTIGLKEAKQQTEKPFELDCYDMEENSNEFTTNDEIFKRDYDNDDVDMDRDWALEDKTSDIESDIDEKHSAKDELPFPCHTCKRSYSSKHSLRKHNYNFHNPNKGPKKPKQPKAEHKCDQCSEVFRSARELGGHKWKHTGLSCDICGKTFTQPSNLTKHKIRHTGIKAHKCKECDKEFYTDEELKSHVICHTGIMPVICEICGKRCRHRGLLTAHMRRHTGERPAKCDVCGKSFFSFHDLNVHAVTHSSERPFKCDICGSTFQRKKALRLHKLIHSKDRKHICKICGKGFAQSGGLNSHMRTHGAALGKTTNDGGQQIIATAMVDSSPMPSESSMLDQYIYGLKTKDPMS